MNGQAYDTNSFYFVLILGTVLLLVMILFIVYFIINHHRTRQKFEWERQQFRQALLQTEVEIREHTLKHISRELHDNLGQIASLVKINLNLLSADVGEKEKERINESLELVRRMIQDIKSLSVSLNNEDLSQLRFTQVVEKDIERINKLESVSITYLNAVKFPQLRPGVEVFLYRMFQELVSNMLRHAGATRAMMEIGIEQDQLFIALTDNGKGFDVQAALGRGSGLTNLAERCRIIGAHLQLESTREKGTTARITLPINH